MTATKLLIVHVPGQEGRHLGQAARSLRRIYDNNNSTIVFWMLQLLEQVDLGDGERKV